MSFSENERRGRDHTFAVKRVSHLVSEDRGQSSVVQ